MKKLEHLNEVLQITELRYHLSCLLANGLSDHCGICGVDYNESYYTDAENELLEIGFSNDDICHEDIQAQMLLDGRSIKLLDEEGEWHDLTLPSIVGQNIDWKELEDNGDFYDNNAILQTAIFGEVIYG